MTTAGITSFLLTHLMDAIPFWYCTILANKRHKRFFKIGHRLRYAECSPPPYFVDQNPKKDDIAKAGEVFR